MSADTEITTGHQIPSPYPGTAPFQDNREDRLAFFGRDQEIRQLLALLLSESQVLLFARSGLGKTSLINAGLLEKLRARNFFPVSARIMDEPDGGPAAAIINRVRDEAARQGVLLEGSANTRSLWAYFDQVQFLKDIPNRPTPVSLRPVLVLDQFEELFTLLAKEKRDALIGELADLVWGRAPPDVRDKAMGQLDDMSSDDPARERLVNIAYGRPTFDVKVLIAIREDFLAELEAFKPVLPDIFRHTLRLEPLTREKARDAIVMPSQQKELLGAKTFDFEPGVVDAMIDFLSSQQPGGTVLRNPDIEPVHLQILCRSLFEGVQQSGRNQIRLADLGGEKGMQRIIRQYYYKVLKKCPPFRLGWNDRRYSLSLSNWGFLNLPRYAAYQLCENGLILPNGVRNSLEGGYITTTYGVPEVDLNELVNQRLLRAESQARGRFYELSHDSLTNVLLAARASRRMIVAAAFAGAIFLIGGGGAPTWKAAENAVVYYQTAPLRAKIADARSSNDKRVEAFSKLEQISDISINLSGLKIQDLRLDKRVIKKGVDLQSAELSNSSFVEVVWTGINQVLWTELDRGIGMEFNLRDAIIKSTAFDRSDLRRAIFDDAKISDSSFLNAALQSSRFVSASISNTSFVGADLSDANFFLTSFKSATTFENAVLENARFIGMNLNEVNFSRARLARANFDGVGIGEKTNFAETEWWLAAGWSRVQIDQLEKSFPHGDYAKTAAYLAGLNSREQTLVKARREADSSKLSSALNSIAWYRAIHGTDLQTADAEADQALEQKENGNVLDTKAYIVMLRARHEEQSKLRESLLKAKGLLSRALGATGRGNAGISDANLASIRYRYALTLDYLGEAAEADKYYKLGAEAGYRPTHELLLMPRPERPTSR